MTFKSGIYSFLAVILLVGSVDVYAEEVWIDVRSLAEYQADHIEGDQRITHNEIVSGVQKLGLSKDTAIHLYCRSGGRAGKALKALNVAGYANVVNQDGIDDARETRGIENSDY